MDDAAVMYQGAALFIVLGAIWAVVGWRAWTGRSRAWAARGRGSRPLMGLPYGIGFVLFGTGLALLAASGDEGTLATVAGVFIVVGLLFSAAGMLFMLSVPFVKDRFYPRWYHELPDDQRGGW
jgi:hypothetical protein